MEDVALQLERSLDTVSRYLAQYLELHRIDDISPWVRPDVKQRVDALIGEFGSERLKPIFDALNGEVPYSHLRIVATHWNIQHADD